MFTNNRLTVDCEYPEMFFKILTDSNLDDSEYADGFSEDDFSEDDSASILKDDLIDRLCVLAEDLKFPHDHSMMSSCISTGSVSFHHSEEFRIHNSKCSWRQYYPVVSFLISGHLHADYARLSDLLGLPNCSSTQWHRIVEKLEEHVTDLAEWSCEQVRQDVMDRGDALKWMATFDGFYLTRGHYSNNSSATLHDYRSGKIAYLAHRTKRGKHSNWSGTSAGAETDMLDEVLKKAKQDGFVIQELVTDKDTSVNATFCQYFPEGTLTYCSNHCAKTLHKNLEKIRKSKCEVR